MTELKIIDEQTIELDGAKSLAKFIHGLQPNKGMSYAYKMGYEAEVFGANETNCDFRIFGSVESMKEWERGKNQAIKDKALSSLPTNRT